MVHQPRHGQRSDRQYDRDYRARNQKAAVVDAYMDSERRQRRPNDRERKGKNEKKSKKEKRRSRNRFAKHLNKQQTNKVLEETKSFKNPVLYTGEISLSRYNPSVAYVTVNGIDRDIRISGFVDRS